MLRLAYTGQFKKDRKRAKKQGKSLDLLREVMEQLAREEPLDAQFRDHKLLGKLKDFRECHVEPDWLLLYRVADGEITFARLGSHAELFR